MMMSAWTASLAPKRWAMGLLALSYCLLALPGCLALELKVLPLEWEIPEVRIEQGGQKAVLPDRSTLFFDVKNDQVTFWGEHHYDTGKEYSFFLLRQGWETIAFTREDLTTALPVQAGDKMIVVLADGEVPLPFDFLEPLFQQVSENPNILKEIIPEQSEIWQFWGIQVVETGAVEASGEGSSFQYEEVRQHQPAITSATRFTHTRWFKLTSTERCKAEGSLTSGFDPTDSSFCTISAGQGSALLVFDQGQVFLSRDNLRILQITRQEGRAEMIEAAAPSDSQCNPMTKISPQAGDSLLLLFPQPDFPALGTYQWEYLVEDFDDQTEGGLLDSLAAFEDGGVFAVHLTFSAPGVSTDGEPLRLIDDDDTATSKHYLNTGSIRIVCNAGEPARVEIIDMGQFRVYAINLETGEARNFDESSTEVAAGDCVMLVPLYLTHRGRMDGGFDLGYLGEIDAQRREEYLNGFHDRRVSFYSVRTPE